MLEDGRSSQGADPHLRDPDRSDALELLLDDREVAAVPVPRPMRDAPPGLSQFETPFYQPIVRVPVRLQPSAGIGADSIFVDLGHVAPLRLASSAASVRGDSWRPPATPRSFSPA